MIMKKARVTADEKRTRTVEFLMEQKTLFNLKELESQLQKHKGIVSQAVKDLLDELNADNQIEKDKIGSGNYFWCFPSQALTSKLVVQQRLEKDIKAAQAELEESSSRKRKLVEEREDTPERKAVLAEMAKLKYEEKQLDEALAAYATNNPEKLKELSDAAEVCREAANRWGDNIHQLVRFYRGRMAEFNYSQFMKHFELDEDVEDIPPFKD